MPFTLMFYKQPDYIHLTMKLFLTLWFIISIQAAIYSKISTLANNTLTGSDYLTSVLGGFRLSLSPATCQLQIQSFQASNYVISGYFPRQPQASCSFLMIANNSLVSNTKNSLLSLPSNQINVKFDEVFLTIDEMAIVRISGVFSNRFQTAQNWISIFRSPQQFIYSISNLSVSSFNSLSFIQNSGNWGFSATKGELRIFRVDNVSKITRYNYTGFLMTANNIYDYNSNSIPYADFKAFKYQPKCTINNSSSIAFQGPFTFVINSYWPQLRVLDQRGYQIVALRYPASKCLSKKGQDYQLNSQSCNSWFCPTNMFQYNGGCVTSCSMPYFHQLGRDQINRCVLMCQLDQVMNNISRICSCKGAELHKCDAKYKATPLGCLCPNGTFYNPINRNSTLEVCLTSCGPFYYPHQDGICVSCPKNCMRCNVSGNSYSYLKCLICEQTYILNQDNLCIKNCSHFLGKILINGTCQNCAIQNCKNCSSNYNKCTACFYPYSLFNNSCVSLCPSGFKSQFKQGDTFECKMIAKCPPQFTQTNQVNNQSKCLCINGKKTTYVKSCFTQNRLCQFDEYYNANSKECLACPVSCLTCVLDSLNRIQCTSCRPDYSLFVTLSKNHYCQRNSILSYCLSNYSLATQTCAANNFQATASLLTNRNSCFKNVTNCIICVWGSDSLCSFCRWGTNLYNGQCYAQCPNNTNSYRIQGVCIERTLQNCVSETTINSYWLLTKNAANQYSQAYYYFLTVNYQSYDILNDPLGSYFTYSTQITGKSRDINIAYSYQRCTVCEQGYGLTPLGLCLPCQPPCLKCIYALASIGSCLKCDQFNRLTLDNTCQKLNPIERPCKVGEYRNQSFICQSQCLSFYRPNYQATLNGKVFSINCTFNCPNGYKIKSTTTQTGKNHLNCEIADFQAQKTQTISFFGLKYSLSGTGVFYFVSSEKLTFLQLNSVAKIYQKGHQRMLTAGIDQSHLYKHQFGFTFIDKNNDFANSPLFLQLQATNILGASKQGNIYVGNSIYGYSNNTVNPIDIIYNQTYNLFVYGRAYSILLLIFTVVFLSQQLNYKTDNLFITYSIIYLTLPSLNLYPEASHFNCYSFLYGFSWSTYLQMLSNPRDLSQQVGWFDGLISMPQNNAHLILFVDKNILRNCWAIFLFLLIVFAALMLLIMIFKCLSVTKKGTYSSNKELNFYERITYIWRKKGYNQTDFDHSYSLLQILTFFIQNSFLALIYYSVINLANGQWELGAKQQLTPQKALSIITILLIIMYGSARFYANRIGGIYCLKRVMLGIWLGTVNILGGIDQNLTLTILLFIKTQLIFLFLRLRFELIPTFNPTFKRKFEQDGLKPKQIKIKARRKIGDRPFQQQQFKQQKKANQKESIQNENQNTQSQKLMYIIVEQLLIMVTYIFLASVNILQQGSILVVWLIINTFIVSFGLDIFDMFMQFWHKNYSNRVTEKTPFYKKIKNIWEFDQSLKSLAETSDF